MKNKQNKKIIIGVFSLIAFLVLLQIFGFNLRLQTFYSENNQLIGYTNTDCNLKAGACSTEPYLQIPTNALNVSFQISQDITPCTTDSISNLNVKYSAMNFKTNQYEQIYTKTYNVGSDVSYYFTGENIYETGLIQRLGDVGESSRNRYYACLPSIANQLPADKQSGDVSYHMVCLYPGDSYNDFGKSKRTYEVIKQVNLNSNYIKDGKVQLKIESSQSTTSCSPTQVTDFWAGNVKYNLAPTPQENETVYYRLENNLCNAISILPSQKTSNDYLTSLDCQTHLQTFECQIDSDCSASCGTKTPICSVGICQCEDNGQIDIPQQTITKVNIWLIIGLIFGSLIVIGGLIWFLIKKK